MLDHKPNLYLFYSILQIDWLLAFMEDGVAPWMEQVTKADGSKSDFGNCVHGRPQ